MVVLDIGQVHTDHYDSTLDPFATDNPITWPIELPEAKILVANTTFVSCSSRLAIIRKFLSCATIRADCALSLFCTNNRTECRQGEEMRLPCFLCCAFNCSRTGHELAFVLICYLFFFSFPSSLATEFVMLCNSNLAMTASIHCAQVFVVARQTVPLVSIRHQKGKHKLGWFLRV